jgi:hypothetical protein
MEINLGSVQQYDVKFDVRVVRNSFGDINAQSIRQPDPGQKMSVGLKRFLLGQHREVLGNYVFDGRILYSKVTTGGT